MSYWYDHEGEGISILVGAVAGAMLVGLAWLGTWWLSSRDPEPRQDVVPSQQEVDEPVAGHPEASEAPSHLERCQSVYDAQRAPLLAAADSLTQWEVHIGAMNKLVVGAITLKQASQFWNQTRVGAHAKLNDFTTARGHYLQRIFRCPAPRQAAEASPELRTCHRAVAAHGRTLRMATIALRRWEQHVHHMDMLRRGEMTAQQATRLWLRDWREGDREIRAYRTAARTGTGQTC